MVLMMGPALHILFSLAQSFLYQVTIQSFSFTVTFYLFIACIFLLFNSSTSSCGSVVIIERGGYLLTFHVVGGNRHLGSGINELDCNWIAKFKIGWWNGSISINWWILKIVNLKCQPEREVGLPVLPSPASIYTCIRRTRLSVIWGPEMQDLAAIPAPFMQWSADKSPGLDVCYLKCLILTQHEKVLWTQRLVSRIIQKRVKRRHGMVSLLSMR